MSNSNNLLKERDTTIMELQKQIEINKASFLSKQSFLEDLLKKKSQIEDEIKIAKENSASLASKNINELSQLKEKQENLEGKNKSIDNEINTSRVVSIFKNVLYVHFFLLMKMNMIINEHSFSLFSLKRFILSHKS